MNSEALLLSYFLGGLTTLGESSWTRSSSVSATMAWVSCILSSDVCDIIFILF
jgi:hypothetical protein